MYTDASFVRRPQAHLPLSGSNFDLCNDVFLDLYNEPEPEFVADATPSAPYLGPTNVCKCPGATGRNSTWPVDPPGLEGARFGRRARGSGTGTGRRRTPRLRHSRARGALAGRGRRAGSGPRAPCSGARKAQLQALGAGSGLRTSTRCPCQSTSAPGTLTVLIRPPSLEPSTPDVREPRA